MGVDTKAIINGSIPLDQIKDLLESKFGEVSIHDTKMPNYFWAVFTDGKDKRNLHIFIPEGEGQSYNGPESEDPPGILLNLGCWSRSVQIMETILEEFGGFIDKNDCDDIGWEERNIEKYKASSKTTKEQLFRWELTKLVGYEKIDSVIELFENRSN